VRWPYDSCNDLTRAMECFHMHMVHAVLIRVFLAAVCCCAEACAAAGYQCVLAEVAPTLHWASGQ